PTADVAARARFWARRGDSVVRLPRSSRNASNPMNPGALELRGITLRIDGRVLIDSLSLSVPPGEVVTVHGPSGCGKSSLLAYLCGTLPDVFAASGTVCCAGIDLTQMAPEGRRLGILFQDD